MAHSIGVDTDAGRFFIGWKPGDPARNVYLHHLGHAQQWTLMIPLGQAQDLADAIYTAVHGVLYDPLEPADD